MSCSGVRPVSWSSVTSSGGCEGGWEFGSGPSDDMAATGTPMPGLGAIPPTLKAGMDGGPATAAVALAVACRLDGVAWRPAVRCKSDAAERFDPAATVLGVGMPADGEDSIEGLSGRQEPNGAKYLVSLDRARVCNNRHQQWQWQPASRVGKFPI